MKTDILTLIAKTIIIVTAIVSFFVYLAQSATPNGEILLYFYGTLIALLYAGGVSFRRTYVWEVSTGRIVAHMSGPVSKSEGILASSWILWFFFGIMTIFVISALFSINDRYDAWIGSMWQPLKIISGWPSFIASFCLLIILFSSWVIRDQYCYRPVDTPMPTPAPSTNPAPEAI